MRGKSELKVVGNDGGAGEQCRAKWLTVEEGTVVCDGGGGENEISIPYLFSSVLSPYLCPRDALTPPCDYGFLFLHFFF